MRRLAVGFFVCAAILTVFGASAMAQTQITLLPSSTGTAHFSASGCPSATCLTVNLGTLTGFAVLQLSGAVQPIGKYTLDISSFTVASSNSGMTFKPTSSPSTSTFSFSNGTDVLSGTMNVTSIADDTHAPRFVAELTITACSGPDACKLWPVNSQVNGDFTITLGGNPILSALWNGTSTSTSGTISSGQALPVPEPASMVFFGSGLLALGAVLRRRKGTTVTAG